MRTTQDGDLHRNEHSFGRIGEDIAVTRDDVIAALRAELDIWKARLDELVVQAALGRMELRDRVAPLLRRVDAELTRIRKDVEELEKVEVVDEEELGYSIRKSMAGLRRDIEEIDQMC